jgi:hypothetical protein
MPEMRPVGEIVAALTAGPVDDELAGEAAAMAAYRKRPGALRPASRAHRRRRRPLSSLLSVAAATGTAVIVGLGALATAAYTGALPSPVQRIAHAIIGAPAAAAGPAASSPVAGSWTTGSAGVSAPNPGTSPAGRPRRPVPTSHTTGQPAMQPTPPGSSAQSMRSDSGTPTPAHRKGKGKPTSHPTPHGHGKPTG